MKKIQLMLSLLIVLVGLGAWSLRTVSAEPVLDHAGQQSATQTPTPQPRRATHTPEPLPGEVTPTPTPDVETEGNGMTGYYISFGVLVALMILNRVLAVRDKRNRPTRR